MLIMDWNFETPSILLGATTLLILYNLLKPRRQNKLPPGPKGWPVLGNLLGRYTSRHFHLVNGAPSHFASQDGTLPSVPTGWYTYSALTFDPVVWQTSCALPSDPTDGTLQMHFYLTVQGGSLPEHFHRILWDDILIMYFLLVPHVVHF